MARHGLAGQEYGVHRLLLLPTARDQLYSLRPTLHERGKSWRFTNRRFAGGLAAESRRRGLGVS